ncbi:MAG: cell division protein SepF [Eubacterium sp.]|nr:cell division protein SepF [Eubacterium sp.]
MSVIDKFLNVMNLNPDDDDYDDYDIDDNDYDEEEEKPSLFRKKDKEVVEEKVTKAPKTTPKIMPMRNSRKNQGDDNMEVCVIKPNNIEDAREITETLLNGRTVVLNMEGLNLDIAQRIIDFTSGSCFAISGNLQKISNYIFIITPPSVEISGDFQELLGGLDGSLHVDI